MDGFLRAAPGDRAVIEVLASLEAYTNEFVRFRVTYKR
jgi:hypothetical protein